MKKYVIVDVDGTIANGDHRHHFISDPDNQDWPAFNLASDKDSPIQDVIELVKVLRHDYEIIFCTGRGKIAFMKTFKWIEQHLCFTAPLLMRADGDHRHDIVVKPELLADADIDLDDIQFILEDRNSMVLHWRSLGLTCLQVAEGDF